MHNIYATRQKQIVVNKKHEFRINQRTIQKECDI